MYNCFKFLKASKTKKKSKQIVSYVLKETIKCRKIFMQK